MCFLAADTAAAKKRDSKADAVISETALQAELFSFGDRFGSFSSQALRETARIEGSAELRRQIAAHLTYAIAAAFTIAADPDPEIGLIDMIVLTNLGRMVYEDHFSALDEAAARPALEAYVTLERDVIRVADPILSAGQKEELRTRLEAFHADQPDLTAYPYIRFSDVPARGPDSTLAPKKSGGIFRTVRRVTEQVEKTRLLAERAVYLGTRLPQMAGFFSSIWVSELAAQPPVERLLGDVHRFSDVADRLALVVEELPDKLARERHDTVVHVAEEARRLRTESLDHLFEGIAAERQIALEQFLAEETRVGGLLTGLRGTFTEANTLVTSVQGLVDTFADGEEKQADADAEPFDIAAYERALVEAGAAARELNTLVQSTDAMTPRLTVMVKEIIDHGFRVAVILIVLLLVGFVAAHLLYHALARRMFGAAPR
jgi:hypothetical protein